MKDVPEDVKNFLFDLHDASRNMFDKESVEELYNLRFIELTDRFYDKQPWPSVELIENECQRDREVDQFFLLFYKEMKMRHLFTKLKPQISDHVAAWHNYISLFDALLLNPELCMSILWVCDIVQEFVYHFQDFCQLRCTTANNKMKEEDVEQTQKKVDEWLDIVGLKGFGNTPTYQLSGGMQQRVALARCLINDPELILMDEPLGALDALTREKMQSLVLKIWKETGKTIILITHSVEEALLLGEKVYVMAPRPGRIHKEYNLPFASRGLNQDLREIKNDKEFVSKREEILSMIWDMEEEIMGKETA